MAEDERLESNAGTPAPRPVGATKQKRKGPRPKHVPRRMCVTCREHDAKRTLTRLVRTADGQVEIDPTGRKNGRGAYLCDNPGCWEKAIKGGLLTRALNTSLSAEAIESLRQHAATLRAAPADSSAPRSVPATTVRSEAP